MNRDLYLAIDLGTGGTRAALVDGTGHILAFSHQEHEQIVPRYGWSEQRPMDWWQGTVQNIRDVVAGVADAASRVAAICACGQMHGSVLIDADGNLTRDTALLWNDKRTAPLADAFAAEHDPTAYLPLTANAATAAWPAFKLLWIAENDPEAYRRADTLLTPKDYIGFQLTGETAWDWTEASMSFLMDARTRDWSDELFAMTGLRRDLFPPIRSPYDILAPLSQAAATEIGLSPGIPVLVGGGDYPVALLGSGVCEPGMGSDVTGTSSIITVLHDTPVIDAEVSNVTTIQGDWGSLTMSDAGGDAVRWARRAFHQNKLSYEDIAAAAAEAASGAEGLLFLPYLSGERGGDHPNSRAQFFGLTAAHGMPELHRAVLEGVAFSVRQKLDLLQGTGGRPEQIIASGGGAKSDLWLRIKASMYDTPYLVPKELECGIIGAACMMATAVGAADDLKSAVRHMVRFDTEVQPIRAWRDRYNRMMPIYNRLYDAAQEFYDDLDKLAE